MVRQGDTVGLVGMTGRSTGPHLHYEVRVGAAPVNPYRFLNKPVAVQTAARDFPFKLAIGQRSASCSNDDHSG